MSRLVHLGIGLYKKGVWMVLLEYIMDEDVFKMSSKRCECFFIEPFCAKVREVTSALVRILVSPWALRCFRASCGEVEAVPTLATTEFHVELQPAS